MERKVIEVDIKTGGAVKGADNLNKSVTDLTAKFEDIYGEMQPLSGRMGELEDRMYELALAGKTNTQEFRDLQQEVGKMKKTIQEVDLIVDATAQTMSQKLGGSLEFASGAFTAVQGATAAFGVESAALEETILKVQSAMAITQGISAMREGYKSVSSIMTGLGAALAKTALGQKALTIAQAAAAVGMKVLNAVMSLNPVFLLIAAFGALAGAFAYFSEEEANTAEIGEKVNGIYNERLELLGKLEKAVKRDNTQAIKELELRGASEQELHNRRLKNLDIEEKLRKAQIIAEKDNINSNRALYKKALEDEDYELAKTLRERIDASKASYTTLTDQHKDYINEKKNENTAYENKQKEDETKAQEKEEADYKARVDKYKAYLNNRLNARRQIEDLELSLQVEGEAKAQEANRIALQRFKEDTLASTALTEDEKNKLIALKEQEAFNNRKAISQQYNDELTATIEQANANRLAEANTAELEALESHEALKTEIVLEHENTRFEAFSEKISKMQEMSAGYFEAASQSLTALDDLNSFLTDKAVADAGTNEAAAEAARKKGFERSKKLQISMAVIQGVQGVMAAFTAGSSMGPAGVVMGPLMAALAGVTAGINIAKIKATQYGSSGGGSPSIPQSVPNPANFNIVGDSGTNQIAETLGQQNSQPIKTYVVSGEVTTAQSLERNKIQNATL